MEPNALCKSHLQKVVKAVFNSFGYAATWLRSFLECSMSGGSPAIRRDSQLQLAECDRKDYLVGRAA
jgi:hypothetical protein